MKSIFLSLALILIPSAHALKQADNKPAYQFETKAGQTVTPQAAVEIAVCKGERLYKVTTTDFKETRQLVEAVVSEKGAVTLKNVK